MTAEAFKDLVKWIEDAYEVDFSEGTRDAWWQLFQRHDYARMKTAAEEMRRMPDLYKPHPGKLDQVYNRLTGDHLAAERRQPLDRPSGEWLKGRLARILAESIQGAWKPTTTLGREAAALFRGLLHASQGACPSPTLTGIAVTALQQAGGTAALKRLEAHDVMLARKVFCEAYIREYERREAATA